MLPDCTIYVAKTKGLISFTVTAKLICVFVFAYAKSRFSHDEAHIMLTYTALVEEEKILIFFKNLLIDNANEVS